MQDTNDNSLLQVSGQINRSITEDVDECKLWLYDNGYYNSISTKNVIYLESQTIPQERTLIHYLDEETRQVRMLSSSYGIGKWEKYLSKFLFCRIHRRYLVNYRQISKFSKSESLVMLRSVKHKFSLSTMGKKNLDLLVDQKLT